jgi:hypothetical protein
MDGKYTNPGLRERIKNRSKAIAEKSGEQFSKSPEKLRGKISRHWKKG